MGRRGTLTSLDPQLCGLLLLWLLGDEYRDLRTLRAPSHLYIWIPPPREPGSSVTISPSDPPEFPLTTFSATCLWPQNPVFRPTVCSNSYQPGGPGSLITFPALLEVHKSCQKCHLEKCLKFKLLQKAEGTCRWTSDQLLQCLPHLQSLCCSRSMPPNNRHPSSKSVWYQYWPAYLPINLHILFL